MIRPIARASFLVVAMLLNTGCGSGGGNSSKTAELTISLAASPNVVNSGENTTVIWSSRNALSCSASGRWAGVKPTSGSESVGPLTVDTTFTLTCTADGGSISQSTTVTVNSVIGIPILSFSASPGKVLPGTVSMLKWTSTGATSCTASGDWSGSLETSGREVVGPVDADSNYTLDCSGPGGTVSQRITVAVDREPKPPDTSPVELYSVEFVEMAGRLGHQGLLSLTEEPTIESGPALCRIVLLGPGENLTFSLVDLFGTIIQSVTFLPNLETESIEDYSGRFDLPAQPFRIRVRGNDKLGRDIDLSSRVFNPRSFKLRFPVKLVFASPGSTISLPVTVTNKGEAGSFNIEFSSPDGLVLTPTTPAPLSLATGESKEILLSAKLSGAESLFSIVTVRGNISNSVDQSLANSSTFEIQVVPTEVL